MGNRTEQVQRIVDSAKYEAFHRRDWGVRRREARGTLQAILGGFASAWFMFILGGFVVLIVLAIAGVDMDANELLIAGLVGVCLALGYECAATYRRMEVLAKAIDEIDEVTRAR